MKKPSKPFTAEQRDALARLLRQRRDWKAHIRSLWMRSAAVSGPYETALYQLRGTHGPAWLRSTTATSLLKELTTHEERLQAIGSAVTAAIAALPDDALGGQLRASVEDWGREASRRALQDAGPASAPPKRLELPDTGERF